MKSILISASVFLIIFLVVGNYLDKYKSRKLNEGREPKISWCTKHGYEYYLSYADSSRIYCLDKENRLVYPDVK